MIKNWKMMMKTTTMVMVTSIFLKDSGETKGRRPEPMTVLAARRISTQKMVVFRLVSKNFFQLIFCDQPRRKRKGAVAEETNLAR